MRPGRDGALADAENGSFLTRDREDRPLPTPRGSANHPGRFPRPARRTAMDLFDDLVGRYRAARIAYESLKPVTLAQWMLESGRGTSRLAAEHLNFGGLKWRSEMLGFATPVAYEASDGLDYYCAFATLDDFVAG